MNWVESFQCCSAKNSLLNTSNFQMPKEFGENSPNDKQDNETPLTILLRRFRI